MLLTTQMIGEDLKVIVEQTEIREAFGMYTNDYKPMPAKSVGATRDIYTLRRRKRIFGIEYWSTVRKLYDNGSPGLTMKKMPHNIERLTSDIPAQELYPQIPKIARTVRVSA